MENYWGNSFYQKDIKNHRAEFLKHVSTHSPCYLDLLYEGPQVHLTVSCEDTDDIPKVLDAGKVFRDGPVPYQLMHNGVRIMEGCYCGDYMTDVNFGLQGHNEPQEEKVFHEVLKCMPENAVMIELGSFWAYYSLWFSKQVPNAQCYLIEPEVKHLEIGRKNFELNQAKGHFFQGVIGASPDYPGVDRVCIDSFLEENAIDHVHILHCDIQGYEAHMLVSAMQSIEKKKIDYFFISTHFSNVHQEIIDFMQMKDYQIVAEHSLRKSYSIDGLIVAKRKGAFGPDHIAISK